jgi:hypothetical protein
VRPPSLTAPISSWPLLDDSIPLHITPITAQPPALPPSLSSRHTNTAYHQISAAQVVCAPSITRRPHIVVVATPGQLNSITHYSHHCPASSAAILSVPRYTNATHHQVSATTIPTDRPSLSYQPHCLTLYKRCISSNFSRSGGLCALLPPYHRGHSWTTQSPYRRQSFGCNEGWNGLVSFTHWRCSLCPAVLIIPDADRPALSKPTTPEDNNVS